MDKSTIGFIAMLAIVILLVVVIAGYFGARRHCLCTNQKEQFSRFNRFQQGAAYSPVYTLPGEPTLRKDISDETIYKQPGSRRVRTYNNPICRYEPEETEITEQGARMYAGVVSRTGNGPVSSLRTGIALPYEKVHQLEGASINTSKIGEYGTEGAKPIEKFDPTCNNSRLQGALLDTSCFAGVMDGKLHSLENDLVPLVPPRQRRSERSK